MAVVTRKITVSKWINIPDNPRQRDTASHAKKALKTHLSTASPTHEIVYAAMIDGEIVCKLDGHTRAYLWETGDLKPPSAKLTVHCFPCETIADACDLYTHFDNQSAVEAAKDRLCGACRECCIPLTSPMLRSFQFGVALQCATKGGKTGPQKEYDLVRLWRDELIEIDGWQLGQSTTALIALALVLVANKESNAKEFFTRFDSDSGSKTEEGHDGVNALTLHMVRRRGESTMSGWENINDLFERAYSCFKAFSDGRRMATSGVRRTSRDKFCLADKRLDKGKVSA